jgi:hypothetical protein
LAILSAPRHSIVKAAHNKFLVARLQDNQTLSCLSVVTLYHLDPSRQFGLTFFQLDAFSKRTCQFHFGPDTPQIILQFAQFSLQLVHQELCIVHFVGNLGPTAGL